MSGKAQFAFERRAEFEPEHAAEVLREVPAGPGVFGLFGGRPGDQPYVTRAADMRRRMGRILAPAEISEAGLPVQSKRLNLRERVVRVEWTATGSEFESLLLLYEALAEWFGLDQARRRMRLSTPFFLRLTSDHAHPRVYSTNRLSAVNTGQMYGPFPSRAAADRYCDAVLDLFRLRRCYEDLEVSPLHPGCAYGEMKKCMAPCNVGCTADEYRAEAEAVQAFFNSHGGSLLETTAAERERASAAMEFEAAAAAHARWEKVKTAAGLADELVRPLPQLRAVIVQAAAKVEGRHAEEAAVFLVEGKQLVGPERLSTLGVRAVREQTSVGSSLFAQPLMLAAVPLEGELEVNTPEVRANRVLAVLAERAQAEEPVRLGDHLSLLRRWYYRPEKQRAGEVFFPNADGSWPVRRILRGAARMAIGELPTMAETDREGVPAAKVRILHEGREGVERPVPVVDWPVSNGRRRGRRKAVVPQDVVSE